MVALPSIPAQPESSLSEDLLTKEVSFGDGYANAVDELNGSRQTWRLVWSDVPVADAVTLRDFFRTNLGSAIVEWSPPDDAATHKYRIVGPLQYGGFRGKARRVSFQLRQVFDYE